METLSRRDREAGAVPTAKFLQARITALSTTLIKRLENILAAALDETHSAVSADGPLPPSLTDTAVQQYQLDVESSALVRAAEDMMILTRTMKEIWLFGELDTLKADGREDEAKRQKMEEDLRRVEEGFSAFLEKYDTTVNVNSRES